MAMKLPPPPIKAPPNDYSWKDWYVKLHSYVGPDSGFSWNNINFAGSNITDIVQRLHSSLQGLQGGSAGQYYHLTSAQVTKLNNCAPLDSPSFTTAVGFNGTSAISKPTVTGSKGGNAALANLLTALANYGLITDSTT